MASEIIIAKGCRYFPQFLAKTTCQELLSDIRKALRTAPLFRPTMPRTGKPFSVQMSNMGTLGWVSDKELGYRYQTHHPVTKKPWPELPRILGDVWQELTDFPAPPEACLVNYYDKEARMGLHQDDDEVCFEAPIISISLGDRARFRLGGLARRDPTRSFYLQSGDIVLLEPPLRLAYHGIDHIIAGSSRLLKEGGRFNLTMRRVNPS